MPECVNCDIKIFADATKAYTVVDDSEESKGESKQRLQFCINQLVSWADTWLLKFNNQIKYNNNT
jgi:hypothetical protein